MAVAGERPAGTVTFVFTDIEGSTDLIRGLGTERFHELLGRHAALIRAAFAAGTEIRTEGDSFFYVFGSAPGAIAAAAAAQRALASEPWPADAVMRVRMGMHTGDAAPGRPEAGADYVGFAVNHAARIAGAGHGGQVLVSEATRAVAREALPRGVSLRDLGTHRLKDLAEETIYQAEVEGLPAAFPPLRTLDRRPNNLPLQPTSFIGREREIAEARTLLGHARLLTLTGPGGTGKTRLSLQVAAEASDGFPDGVYFVPLAAISERDLVPPAIARAVGAQVTGGRPPLEALLEHLAGKQVLLVLDNFEQVLEAGDVVSELLRGAPDLRVLATSRAALRVSGEQELPVPPLGLPDPASLPSLEALSQYEAVRLFIERAVAVRPDFRVTNENAPAVAEICARLDGLPLAIELAAARIKLLTPEAMLSRLGRRLSVVADGARDLPARQRTLRGAIAWSHDLLEEPARRLFARFAVFVRGASLEAVENVCGPSDEIGVEVLDGLSGLVDQSLVRQREVEDQPRFGMLETIREYALERLAESGEEEPIRARHAAFYAALAETCAADLLGPRQRESLDRLELEHDNLRAALERSIARGDAESALRLVASLWRFWQFRGHLREGRGRAERALVVPASAVAPGVRVRALDAAGGITYWLGDFEAARVHYEEQVRLTREVGEPAALANALYNLAFLALITGTRLEEAKALVEEARALWHGLGDRTGVANVSTTRAGIHMLEKEYQQAWDTLSEVVPVYREHGHLFGLKTSLALLASAGIRMGRLRESRRVLAEGLSTAHQGGDLSAIVVMLATAAELAAAEGDDRRAARIWGARRALAEATGTEVTSRIERERGFVQALDEALGRLGLAAEPLLAEGRAMDRDRAIAYAIEELATRS